MIEDKDIKVLFEPHYPWQDNVWQKLSASFPTYPHAMLFSGRAGTGKTNFIWRFLAWILCQDKQNHACGKCTSCQWLKTQTHPNFLYVTVATDSKSQRIKVDDVRAILPFAQQSSQGMRIIFIKDAHLMNIAAANALLKTLEEPASNVLILMSSDQPQLLLPTIKSRVQRFDVSTLTEQQASDFLADKMLDYQNIYQQKHNMVLPSLTQLLAMTGGAPLKVLPLLESKWLIHRNTWLKVWQALRVGQRNSIVASNFWQKQFGMDDAILLQKLMCVDVLALINGLPTIQQDVDFNVLKPLPSANAIAHIQDVLNQFIIEQKQNVQSIYLFEKLMLTLRLS